MSLSNLIQNLEKAGCQMEALHDHGKSVGAYEILIPGFDLFFLSAFQTESSWSPISQGFMKVIQRSVWERIELTIDREQQTIHSRWVYWSPTQILMHAAISFLFLLECWSVMSASGSVLRLSALLIGSLAANLIPIAFSFREAKKMRQLFDQAGFRAS